ncbi:MAG: hypothetical protein ACR9NN_03515 [Nostochopsis sp.]
MQQYLDMEVLVLNALSYKMVGYGLSHNPPYFLVKLGNYLVVSASALKRLLQTDNLSDFLCTF